MTTDALTLFARQLASWARQIIDNGRSPFRRVELSPVVQTEHGPIRPPLVFWINRQSLMAGGILMLPANRAEEDLQQAAACARSLGLSHFVSWAPAEIVFWQTEDGEPPKRCKNVRIDGTGDLDIDRFRDELALVMDELKLLSVTGNIAPRQLSEHYLVNLCLGYLNDSRGKLAETFRVARGEGRIGAPQVEMEPEAWARQRGALSLFQLLGLSFNDLLPDSAQPERLEQAMRLHLTELPPGLAPAPGSAEELPLPEEVAVSLHHLFRRLGQVGWRHDPERALATVRLLLQHLGTELGMRSLTNLAPASSPTEATLLVNAFGTAPAGDAVHFVGSPAALAGAALERDILDLPPFAGTAQSPLGAGIAAEKVKLLLGGLDGGFEPAPRQSRRKLEDSLRRSWPTRRFALPPRTPAWVYGLLHLLGLVAPGCRAILELGPEWLDRRLASSLFDLLEEQFALTEVRATPNGRHRLSLLRKPASVPAVAVLGPHGERQVPTDFSGADMRSRIVLALQLPPEFYRLVAGEQLQIPADEEWAAIPEAGLRLFAASSLGRGLSQLVCGKRLQPDDAALAVKWRQSACPLPAPEVLNHLQRLAGDKPERKEIDAELAFWLDTDLTATAISGSGSGRGSRRRPSMATDRNRMAEEISARVFIDGIPRFPEQYLFDYYRPDLVDYDIGGPLRIASSFFQSIELEEDDGRRFEVEGDETARALVLASFGQRRTVSLPVSRQTTGEILQRYRDDLKRLRRQLVRETHARVGDSKSASALIDQIWNHHAFPPWDLIVEA